MKVKFSAIALSVLLAISFSACAFLAQEETKSDAVYQGTDGRLVVHFIDVGQGDCEFIEFPNGETMLIDAGESDAGDTVVDYLQSFGVSVVDYVVATHPHSDHIGGLPAVFDAFDIKTVYMPDASSSSYTFELLLDKIEAEGCETVQAAAGVSAVSDDDNHLSAYFTAPVSEKYEDLNNYSAVLRLEYEKVSFLFMGDAEALSEKEILKSGNAEYADVLKVGHHGSKTSSSAEFIECISPRFAVFEAGRDNSYGHPHKEVLESFERLGAEILRTDEMGTIVISSNGYDLEIKDFISEQTQTRLPEDKADACSYVLNTASKKIHLPDCPSAESISDKNKQLTDESIEKLEVQGYSCCKGCNPKG